MWYCSKHGIIHCLKIFVSIMHSLTLYMKRSVPYCVVGTLCVRKTFHLRNSFMFPKRTLHSKKVHRMAMNFFQRSVKKIFVLMCSYFNCIPVIVEQHIVHINLICHCRKNKCNLNYRNGCRFYRICLILPVQNRRKLPLMYLRKVQPEWIHWIFLNNRCS